MLVEGISNCYERFQASYTHSLATQAVLHQRHVGDDQTRDSRRARVDEALAGIPRKFQGFCQLLPGLRVHLLARSHNGDLEDVRDGVSLVRADIVGEHCQIGQTTLSPLPDRTPLIDAHHQEIDRCFEDLPWRCRPVFAQFFRIAQSQRVPTVTLS